jgi:hypothetical protein
MFEIQKITIKHKVKLEFKFSVERALEQGAEKFTDEIDVERLTL